MAVHFREVRLQPQPQGVNYDQSSHGDMIQFHQVKQMHIEVCGERTKTESTGPSIKCLENTIFLFLKNNCIRFFGSCI